VKKFCLPILFLGVLVPLFTSCGGGSLTRQTTTANPLLAGVQVSSPANNSTVGSPVTYTATATTTCSKGVNAIGVFTASGVLAFKMSGAKLNTTLALSPGTYNTTVQEWDNCNSSAATPVTITVSQSAAGGSSSGGSSPPQGNTLSNLHQGGGWTGFGLLPPSYSICNSCSPSGPQVTWAMKQAVSAPSLSGNSTQFDIGGTTPYTDALWNNHLIGDFSSQGLPDGDNKINTDTHNFTYDVYFFANNLPASQALEFDINQFVDGQSFIWGHECRISGGHEWDIWDNPGQKWHPTGIACNPNNNAWNHLTIQVQRTSDNHLLFQTITLNGQTATLNYSESPTSTPWNGITINYQMDGDGTQQPYSIWLDKLNFTYW
jgi:hypothetical protein